MGTIFTACLLGILEGLTEFMPVSSTGHLIIANMWFYFSPQFTQLFDIFIQFGAILAVVWVYRQGIVRLFLTRWTLWIAVSLPAFILGFIAHGFIKSMLFTPRYVALALIVGAIAMILTDRYHAKRIPVVTDLDHISLKKAACIGIAQCFALWPGMSRSASTIMGGVWPTLTIKPVRNFHF